MDFAIINEACCFCGNNQVIKFHEHYYFCPECSAIYTFNILQSSECDHIKDGVPTVLREPWYKSARSKTVYAKEIDKAGYTVCSKCGKQCVVDGW